MTGALVIDTVLLLLVARVLWHWRPWKLALAAVAFGGVELTFLAANLSKVAHGGWLPLLIALAGVHRHDHLAAGPGDRRRRTAGSRRARCGSSSTSCTRARLPRVPGDRGLPAPRQGHHPAGPAGQRRAQPGPPRGRAHRVRELGQRARTCRVAERFEVDDLGYDGRRHPAPVRPLRVLRRAEPAGGAAPRRARPASLDAADPSVDEASYFLSRGVDPRTRGEGDGAAGARSLFLRLAHNAADPAAYFGLPVDRTVTMGSPVEI